MTQKIKPSCPMFQPLRPARFLLLGGLFLCTVCFPGAAHAELESIGLVLTEGKRSYAGEQIYTDENATDAVTAATEAFLASRRFQVVEREALDQVFKEKDLKGFLGDVAGAEITDTLGLDWIGLLSYSVDKVRRPDGQIGYSYLLTVRMVDVAVGQVVKVIESRERTSQVSRGLFNAARKWATDQILDEVPELEEAVAVPVDSMYAAGQRLLQNILAEFPPQGYVVQVIDKRNVVVDLGVDEGVVDGDLLEVFVYSPPSIHPVTGVQLPGREIIQGLLKVVNAGVGLSTCKIKDGEESIGEGVRVRFRPKGNLVDRWGHRLLSGN